MKPTQYFALVIGVMFTLVGAAGFIPAFVQPPAATPDAVNLSLTVGYGYLFGIFPINVLHNVVHLTVGLLGIFASIALDSSRLYSGALALFYGLLTIMGLIPTTESTLGFIPIFGNDIWLHAGTAAIAAYFGFIATPTLAELGARGIPEQTPATRPDASN